MLCRGVRVLTILLNQLKMGTFGARLVLIPKLCNACSHLFQVCDCIMNSGAQAQAHLTGTKHRHRMDKVEQEMMDKVGVGRSLLDKVGWGWCR